MSSKKLIESLFEQDEESSLALFFTDRFLEENGHLTNTDVNPFKEFLEDLSDSYGKDSEPFLENIEDTINWMMSEYDLVVIYHRPGQLKADVLMKKPQMITRDQADYTLKIFRLDLDSKVIWRTSFSDKDPMEITVSALFYGIGLERYLQNASGSHQLSTQDLKAARRAFWKKPEDRTRREQELAKRYAQRYDEEDQFPWAP